MSGDDELGEGEVAATVVGGVHRSGWGGSGGAVQYRGHGFGVCASCPVAFEM